MRTIIRIDEPLLQEAKHLAVRTSPSLTAVIEDALREALARHRETAPRQPVALVTVGGKGLRPGVDLDDSASLLDLMEALDLDPG